MTDAVRAIILGIVEGLTEFLPISSTGHMILVMPWIGIHKTQEAVADFWNTFDIFIQLAAILAVVIYFRARLMKLTTVPTLSNWRENFPVKIFVAFLPAAVIGLMANDYIEEYLKNPQVTAWALIGGGVVIIAIERIVRHPNINDAATVSLRIALVIGFMQCLAMIPGTSRSGATIMGALLLGLTPAAAAEFSFFLAIPTMFAAGLYALYKHWEQIPAEGFMTLAIGSVVSFFVAWAVVAMFMKFIQRHKFTSFAIYRIILGAIVLGLIFTGRFPHDQPRPADTAPATSAAVQN